MNVIRSRESLPGYDAHVPSGELRPGITAVLRVRDEARNLPWVLPPLLDAVTEIVLVDNGSTDDTPELAHRIAVEHGAADRLQIHSYPVPIARCGAEHLATPPDSVHSLTHYYNWSFGHVRTTYSLKWDGDMVLTAEGVAVLRELQWQLVGDPVMVALPHPPLYVVDESLAYLDVHRKQLEPWLYPVGPDYVFVKGFDWEVRGHPPDLRRVVLPEGLCFEIKWVDADEFSHWTDEDFDEQRVRRKVREREVFDALRAGRPSSVVNLLRADAPAGQHVIDHAAGSWLPGLPRPLKRRDAD